MSAIKVKAKQAAERRKSIGEKLDVLLDRATRNVRPSEEMIRFYNAVGRLPFRLGTIALLSTSIDGLKVVYFALRKRTDAALQVMYNYNSYLPILRGPFALGDALWQGSYNARSVRARGQFVKETVRVLLEELGNIHVSRNDGRPVITAVSLGSGSATQFLKGISSNDLKPEEARVILVDHDSQALRAAQGKALNLGVEVNPFLQTIGQFFFNSPGAIHLCEMVGLTDYFKDHQLRRYFRRIFKALASGGFFLGANISSEEERAFAHGAACWPNLHYRSEEELLELLKEAGFEQIWTGACGLYMVWVAQKVP